MERLFGLITEEIQHCIETVTPELTGATLHLGVLFSWVLAPKG